MKADVKRSLDLSKSDTGHKFSSLMLPERRTTGPLRKYHRFSDLEMSREEAAEDMGAKSALRHCCNSFNSQSNDIEILTPDNLETSGETRMSNQRLRVYYQGSSKTKDNACKLI